LPIQTVPGPAGQGSPTGPVGLSRAAPPGDGSVPSGRRLRSAPTIGSLAPGRRGTVDRAGDPAGPVARRPRLVTATGRVLTPAARGEERRRGLWNHRGGDTLSLPAAGEP